MKKRLKDLTDAEIKTTLDALYTAAGSLKGREPMKAFLKDLLTISERIMLGRRLMVGRMLIRGMSYEEISRDLKVSHTTIERVNKWLKGLEEAIYGLEHEYKRRADVTRYQKSVLFRLKKKYPLYFLLIPKAK